MDALKLGPEPVKDALLMEGVGARHHPELAFVACLKVFEAYAAVTLLDTRLRQQ